MSVLDISAALNRKRKEDQLLDGICHSQEYKAVRYKGNDPVDCTVWIDVYAGNEPTLNICFEDESRLVSLTRSQAVQLAKDIWLSIECV